MVHGLSLQTTQLSPNSRGSIITPGARQYPPLGVQVHPTYPMYPLLYQSPFQPGISYIMDPANAAVHAASPGQGTYQTVRPVYQPLSPFMHLQSDYSRPGPPFNYGRVDSRRQNAARISRSPYYNAASHHNHVDVSRIRDGIDVRTTASPSGSSSRHALIGCRSCFEIYRTRSTRLCSSGLWMSRAGGSMTSCICESTSPMTASRYFQSRCPLHIWTNSMP